MGGDTCFKKNKLTTRLRTSMSHLRLLATCNAVACVYYIYSVRSYKRTLANNTASGKGVNSTMAIKSQAPRVK